MTNSLKRCTGCHLRFPPQSLMKLPVGLFHSTSCAIYYASEKSRLAKKRRAAKIKATAIKRKKGYRKDLLEFNRRTIKWQHKQTKPVFNRMRVLEELKWFAIRGIAPACISCGKELGGDIWCCGHFKTVGAQSDLMYDKRNTYLQHNRSCNMSLSGDIAGTKNTPGYKQGLLNRFGNEQGQRIIDYCETYHEPVKWTWEKLEAFRKECNKTIRGLKNEF